MRPRHARTSVVALATGALFLAAVLPTLAQQRALDHDDVPHWNTIDDPSLSPDGDWLAFVLTPMEGDPALALKAAAGEGPALTVRGNRPDVHVGLPPSRLRGSSAGVRVRRPQARGEARRGPPEGHSRGGGHRRGVR
ncbi:MAG: PD40 domain-containing protein [Acidobacteria bacterium]|nr:PD40 domain-containing protein [Acidobacteriota bacterium]